MAQTMGVYLEWDERNSQLLHVVLADEWDWMTYWDAMTEAATWMHAVAGTVHVMVEFTANAPLPGAGGYIYWKRTLQKAPDNIGCMVIITHNALQRGFIDAAADTDRFLRGRLFTAETCHDAQTIICEHMQAAAD